MAIWTAERVDLVREQRGRRDDGRDVHYDLCDGLLCPCFQEGGKVRAYNHRTMLEWFAKTDPDLVRQVLNEAENERAANEAALNGSE